MLLFGKNWAQHRLWVFLSVVVLLGASGWFFAAAWASSEWPGGSSLPGFTFGVLGGLIIVFECLLWLRKKLRIWRVGQVQAWLRAHIWLGLLCLPLLVYHSGFRFGGPLSTYLMVLLIVVVVSGVWGLWMQQRLPRRMLEEVPAETIYSQIERLARQQVSEMEDLVRAVCGPAPGEEAAPVTAGATAPANTAAHLIIGAVRTAGRVQGKVLETWVPPSPIVEAETLRDFFQAAALPYLKEGNGSDSPLRFRNRAAVMFQDLRTKLPAEAHPAVDRLETACDQRRQWDEQARLHWWLHGWLLVHFPLSVALLVLMGVHIWVALKYW